MEKSTKPNKSFLFLNDLCQWLLYLFRTYDRSFLIVAALISFSQGFKIFLDLQLKSLFKDHLKWDPSYAQMINSIINLPWSFKIVMGLISDNVAIGGSKRKVYIILNAVMQFVATFLLVWVDMGECQTLVIILLTMANLNQAFFNVVINALMIT